MNTMYDVVVIVLVIVATIIYFAFSIWNAFISKKQIVASLIDLLYFQIVGAFSSLIWAFHGIKFVLMIFTALVLWSIVLTYTVERNKREKEEYVAASFINLLNDKEES